MDKACEIFVIGITCTDSIIVVWLTKNLNKSDRHIITQFIEHQKGVD